ncbi:MAG: hypothetical protein L3J41_15620 [Melioribacteraceae bacterium]|nr:hypothetical protein [Melioribacteraceae bacterium]
MMPKQFVKLALIFVFISLSTSLIAQVDSTKADRGVNINFFNGYALAYKWNASQSMNYRVYLSLNSSLSGDKYDSENKYDENTKRTGEQTEDRTFVNMNLSFQFLFNIISQKSFNLYLGVGPNLSYSYRKWENNEKNKSESESSNYEYSSSESSYGVGVVSLIGIEAYLTNTITLFAETHLLGSKSWSNYNNTYSNRYNNSDNTGENSRTGSGWSANFQLVKVGFGIYF